MIPQPAQDLIETWRLGFIATADTAGRPNVSPKGTFIVEDERTVSFVEMRSPRTMANLSVRQEVEVNFVDILSRRGFRLRGRARVSEQGSPVFSAVLPRFTAMWGDLEPMFNAIVHIDVESCTPLRSPIYEVGAREADLRRLWRNRIVDMVDGQESEAPRT